jgi:hypothetical protein
MILRFILCLIASISTLVMVQAGGDTVHVPWTRLPMPPNERPRSVMVIGSDTVMLTASSVCTIHDMEMERIIEPLQQQQLTSLVVHQDSVHVLTGNGLLYTSRNGGLTWQRSQLPRTVRYMNVSNGALVTVHSDGRVMHSVTSPTTITTLPKARWATATRDFTYVLANSVLYGIPKDGAPKVLAQGVTSAVADDEGLVHVLIGASRSIVRDGGLETILQTLRPGEWSELFVIKGGVVAVDQQARTLAVLGASETIDYLTVPDNFPGRLTSIVGTRDSLFVSRALDQGSVLLCHRGTWTPRVWNLAGQIDVPVLAMAFDHKKTLFAVTRSEGIWVAEAPDYMFRPWSAGLQPLHPTRQFTALGGCASTLTAGFIHYSRGRLMPGAVVGSGGYGAVLDDGTLLYVRLDGSSARSVDQGATWTIHTTSDSLAGIIDVVAVAGRLLLFEQRRVLTSSDAGLSWTPMKALGRIIRPSWLAERGGTMVIGAASGTLVTRDGTTWGTLRSPLATDSVEVFTSGYSTAEGFLFGGRYGLYAYVVDTQRWYHIPLPGARSAIIVGLIGNQVFCTSDDGTLHRATLP